MSLHSALVSNERCLLHRISSRFHLTRRLLPWDGGGESRNCLLCLRRSHVLAILLALPKLRSLSPGSNATVRVQRSMGRKGHPRVDIAWTIRTKSWAQLQQRDADKKNGLARVFLAVPRQVGSMYSTQLGDTEDIHKVHLTSFSKAVGQQQKRFVLLSQALSLLRPQAQFMIKARL